MRVIAGLRKGLKLKSPEGLGTRPTTDRVKESLFNLIQFHFPTQRALDLFAGSGALGLEALSRGTAYCDFVDSGRDAVALVKENLSAARFEGQAGVHQMDARSFLLQASAPYDVIFLDPPYNKGMLEPVIKGIAEQNLLKDGGILVAETERGGEPVPDTYYSVKKSVAYGKTVITILQR